MVRGSAITLRSMYIFCSLLSWATFEASALESRNIPVALLSRLERSGRRLGQSATPDCGRAFQPCCTSGNVCTDPDLSCIAREPQPRCEPCGAPFAQPCPTSPYCEEGGLIPTTRRSDVSIQCRPCGLEWQPCCATLGSLCTSGFTCYAEQDRCVVPEYTYVKEEFFPDLIPVSGSGSPICGGLNDPPCMEPSSQGPTWQCDDGLVTHIPVFLCMLDYTDLNGTVKGCGSHLKVPCEDGCVKGLTFVVLQTTGEAVCVKTFSLATDNDLPAPLTAVPTSMPQTVSSSPPPMKQTNPSPPPPVKQPSSPSVVVSDQSVAKTPEKPGTCGGNGNIPCGSGCDCGFMVGPDGLCGNDPQGCLDAGGPSQESPTAQIAPGGNAEETASQNSDDSGRAVLCGVLGAEPCSAPLVRPCQCGLFLDASVGTCAAEITSAPCPVRPYCGFESGPPCSFPGDQPCDECLEVDPITSMCIRNPTCVRGGAIEDQSFRCGRRGAKPCPSPPLCRNTLVVGESGRCEQCGHKAGAVPCESHPACKGRRVAEVEGITLDTCENCGSEGEPPCSDNLSDAPCDDRLFRTSVKAEDIRLVVVGQRSICTSQEVAGQCGFVGQDSCDGVCLGRSNTSKHGKMCIECGAASQAPCDGLKQDRCDAGLEEHQEPGQEPVCVCPDSGCALQKHCPEDAISDQSGPGGIDLPGGSLACGELGELRCVEEPGCGDRLLADEDGICHPCGDDEGAVPCPDEPPCGYRLAVSQSSEVCVTCGGENQLVCCDGDVCSQEDPLDTPCDAGLSIIGVQVDEDLELRSPVAEAYCSELANPATCGKVGRPPCDVGDEVGPDGRPARPCSGLSTPSEDGLSCVQCGRNNQPPCINRFKLCTGKLVAVFDEDKPSICTKPTFSGRDGRTIDQSADPAGCGTAGQPWCRNSLNPCIGRTIAAAEGVCSACGGAGQFVCISGSPCNGLLRQWKTECVECGAAKQAVCDRPALGPPCNAGLKATAGVCQEEGVPRDIEDQSGAGQGRAPVSGNAPVGCGTDGAEACSGQPICGKGLFVVIESERVMCTSKQPTTQYPDGDSCGGLGELLCNDAPHCNDGLFMVLPEGICVPQQPTAIKCGLLGHAPCTDGPDCEGGLVLRADENICATARQVPCGIRGFPVCIGQQSLCSQLLSPAFPLMICVDSVRGGAPEPCGVLGSTACIGLACTSPLVVQPSTAVCVPAETEPCGKLEESQCFWNGRRPCDADLFSDNGICRQ